MFENVLRFTSKVENFVSHWILENGTSIEVAEKMALQFLQHLGQVRASQEAQIAAQKLSDEANKPVEQVPLPDFNLEDPKPAE